MNIERRKEQDGRYKEALVQAEKLAKDKVWW